MIEREPPNSNKEVSSSTQEKKEEKEKEKKRKKLLQVLNRRHLAHSEGSVPAKLFELKNRNVIFGIVANCEGRVP